MIKQLIVAGCLCVAFMAAPTAMAQLKSTKLRGTVQDATTKAPIAGATVSASGDVARESEVTDDQGFFRILIAGVSPGNLVRIRVQKIGYAVYDRQVVSSEEIPLDIQLHRAAVGGATPAQAVDPVAAQFIKQMNDPDISVRLNALEVLANMAAKSAPATSAVIAAALNGDYRVRARAAQLIGWLAPKSKDAVTNLIIATHDVEPQVQAYAVNALAAFPKNKDAQSTLFSLMGEPPKVNTRAMSSLAAMGVNDSRLAQAVFYEVTLGSVNAISVLKSQAPLPKELISRLIVELGKNLESRQTIPPQRMLGLLLKAGGAPARDALHSYLSGADSYHKARLALSWLEVEHTASAELLQYASLADLSSEWKSAMNRAGMEIVSLPETEKKDYPVDEHSDDIRNACDYGYMLRAAMGEAALALPDSETAQNITAYALTGSNGRECGDYAAVALRWYKPAVAKRLIPLLARNLLCRPNAQDIDNSIVADTLAELGDENTIAMLQKMAAERIDVCGNDDYDSLGKTHLDKLTQRIRDRIK